MMKEKEIKDSTDPVSLSGTSIILYQMIKCVCKIRINTIFGTGFFCRIPYGNDKTMDCLMTNYHVIDENVFKENKEINLLLNNENDGKTLNLEIKRKNYFNKDYDIAIIEIKESDKIEDFLELDDNLFKDNTKLFFEQKSIYTIQYPNGNNVVVSYGLANNIDDFNIKHTCNTTKGSSGSPILNLSNNKLIGIHKEGSVKFNYNKGTFLKFPLNNFYEKNDIQHLNTKSELDVNDLNNKEEKILIKNINDLINVEKIKSLYESSIKENIEKSLGENIFNLNKGKEMKQNEIDKIEKKCVMVDNDGNKYEGFLKNGKYEGNGVMQYSDNSRYEGDWKNGKYEGKGVMLYNDNSRYEGDWKNGKYDGKGTMYYNDGGRYEGEWKNGRYDGKGMMYYSDGGRYDGDWKNGLYDGEGKMFYGDGARYEGGFKNGKREGKGAMFYLSGYVEKGEWKNDKKVWKGFFFKFW